MGASNCGSGKGKQARPSDSRIWALDGEGSIRGRLYGASNYDEDSIDSEDSGCGTIFGVNRESGNHYQKWIRHLLLSWVEEMAIELINRILPNGYDEIGKQHYQRYIRAVEKVNYCYIYKAIPPTIYIHIPPVGDLCITLSALHMQIILQTDGIN